MIIESYGIPAIGNCEVCKKEEVNLWRTYFKFPHVKCECHSPYHFEIVEHCETCEPKPPRTTKIEVTTENLNYIC